MAYNVSLNPRYRDEPHLSNEDLVTAQTLDPKYKPTAEKNIERQNRTVTSAKKTDDEVLYDEFDPVAQHKNSMALEKANKKYGKQSSVPYSIGGGGYLNPAGSGYMSPAGGFSPLLLAPLLSPLISQGIKWIVKSIKGKKKEGKGLIKMGKEYYTPGAIEKAMPQLEELEQMVYNAKSGGSFWKNLWSGVKKGIKYLGPKLIDVGLPVLGSLATAFIKSKFGKGMMDMQTIGRIKNKKYGGRKTNQLLYGDVMLPILESALSSMGIKKGGARDELLNQILEIGQEELNEPYQGGISAREAFEKIRTKGIDIFNKVLKSDSLKTGIKVAKTVGEEVVINLLQNLIDKKFDAKFDSMPKEGKFNNLLREHRHIVEGATNAVLGKTIREAFKAIPEDLSRFAKGPGGTAPRFDPQTGRPLTSGTYQTDGPRFDAQTGEPLYSLAEEFKGETGRDLPNITDDDEKLVGNLRDALSGVRGSGRRSKIMTFNELMTGSGLKKNQQKMNY